MTRILKGFIYAFAGLKSFFTTEQNGRLQAVIAIVVVLLGLLAGITISDWMWVGLCIVLVLSLEMVNSSIEKICNLISREYHPEIKIIKDISAGAVLLASIFSFIIGCVIFYPYIIDLLS